MNVILDQRFHALLRGLTVCVTCVLSFSLQALTQESNLRHIPIAWFEEPDQHAPHWRVHFDRPTLTYSQRLVVGVQAIVPANGKERPDWHILLRIADESGRWFENNDYFRVDLRPMPPKAEPVVWHGYAFVQPGAYRLALVAYDAINERHFVWRKMMRVDRPSVLPDMDRDLPKVEFVDLSQIRPPIPEYLPVHTQAPVQIDVIFNLTGNQQLSLTPNNIDSFRPFYAEDALRGAIALLSQLAPSQGCVRVSAIDILRLKVALDRSSADPASNLNQIQQAIPSVRDNASVDAHTLMGRTKAREFFHQFLEKVIATMPHAALGSPKETAPSSSSAIALSSPRAPTGNRSRHLNIAMPSSSMSSSHTPGLLQKIRCLPPLPLSMNSGTCSANFIRATSM